MTRITEKLDRQPFKGNSTTLKYQSVFKGNRDYCAFVETVVYTVAICGSTGIWKTSEKLPRVRLLWCTEGRFFQVGYQNTNPGCEDTILSHSYKVQKYKYIYQHLPGNSPGLDHEWAAAAAVWHWSSCSGEPASVGWKTMAAVCYEITVNVQKHQIHRDKLWSEIQSHYLNVLICVAIQSLTKYCTLSLFNECK